MVFGQSNFSDNKYNRNNQASAATLNDPYGLWLEEEENPEWVPPDEKAEKSLEEDTSNGSSSEEDAEENSTEEEIPEYLFKLFIADRGNSRVVVWNELPVLSKEEDEEGDDEIEIEDSNLLIGEDEDEDYTVDEEEDSPPKELPSV